MIRRGVTAVVVALALLGTGLPASAASPDARPAAPSKRPPIVLTAPDTVPAYDTFVLDVAVPPEGGGAEPVPPYGPPSGGSLLPLQPVMAATAIALVSAKRESDARVVVVHIMASYLRVRRAGGACGSRSALFVAHSDRSSSQHRQAAERCDRNETFEA